MNAEIVIIYKKACYFSIKFSNSTVFKEYKKLVKWRFLTQHIREASEPGVPLFVNSNMNEVRTIDKLAGCNDIVVS